MDNNRQVRVHRRHGQELLPFPGHRPLISILLSLPVQWAIWSMMPLYWYGFW